MAKKVIYLGDDDHYFEQLKIKLHEIYPNEKFILKQFFDKKTHNIQRLIIPTLAEDADIIFIDYTPHPKKMLTLGRTLRRCLPHLKSIIGLWDYRSTEKQIQEGNTTGVYINHIKTVEFSSLLYQAYMLAMDSSIPKISMATAHFKDKVYWSISHNMKIGFMTNQYIHCEHNLKLEQDQVIELKFNLFKSFSIKKVKNIRPLNQNFFYHFKYISDFEFIDEARSEEEGVESSKEKIKNEREDIIHQWISKNKSSCSNKRLRMMIIDEELNLLKQTTDAIDSLPFSIRYYREFNDQKNIIKRIKPGIIVYNFPQEDNEGQESASEIDHLSVLQIIQKKITSIQGHNPFLLITNSPYETEDLKSKIKYDNLTSSLHPFDLDKILEICTLYKEENARAITHDMDSSFSHKEERIYFEKCSKESNSQFETEIALKELTEAYLIFNSTIKIIPFTIFKILAPIKMFITVVPSSSEKSKNHKEIDKIDYIGHIHSLGEKEKSGLRVYINQIIFKNNLAEKEDKEVGKDEIKIEE